MSVLVPERPLRDLVAGPPSPRSVLRPPDVGGTAAWQVLVRDGAVRVLRGDAGCRPDVVVGPALRAGLVASEVPTGAVVTGRTAVWIHTGAGDGEHLDLTCAAGRHRPDRPVGARLWQSPLLAADTVVIAGAPVTVAERTAVELALHDDDPVRLLVALAQHGTDLDRVRRRLELRHRAVGRPRARRHLEAAREALGPTPATPRARARGQA
ncbi:hypothetical protein [Isoptericola aurantiacus]|uniref:hypothetical protein n=1 Tax=Isoptericola aurantiacus TaxID=3377839 RepID=UPI00383A86F9